MPLSLVVLSYFRLDIFSSLYFKANDSHCDIRTEGVGIHCFGDFNQGLVSFPQTRTSEFQNHIWLSPLDGIISRVSSLMTSVISPRTILLITIVLYVAALLVPMLDVWTKIKRHPGLSLVSVIYLGSYPFVASLDRMNSICLAVPIVYLLFCKLLSGSKQYLTPLFILACIVKPHLLLLSVALFILYGYKEAIKNLVLAVLSFSLVEICLHRFSFDSPKNWIDNLFTYGTSNQSLSQDYPNNISFPRALYFVSTRIGFPSFSDRVYLLISAFIGVVFVLILMFAKNRFQKPDAIFMTLIILIFSFSNVVFHYYTILLVVFEIARFRTDKSSIFNPRINLVRVPTTIHLRKILFLLILIPIPIPIFGYFKSLSLIESTQTVIPILNPVLVSIMLFVTLIVITQQTLLKKVVT